MVDWWWLPVRLWGHIFEPWLDPKSSYNKYIHIIIFLYIYNIYSHAIFIYKDSIFPLSPSISSLELHPPLPTRLHWKKGMSIYISSSLNSLNQLIIGSFCSWNCSESWILMGENPRFRFAPLIVSLFNLLGSHVFGWLS